MKTIVIPIYIVVTQVSVLAERSEAPTGAQTRATISMIRATVRTGICTSTRTDKQSRLVEGNQPAYRSVLESAASAAALDYQRL